MIFEEFLTELNSTVPEAIDVMDRVETGSFRRLSYEHGFACLWTAVKILHRRTEELERKIDEFQNTAHK